MTLKHSREEAKELVMKISGVDWSGQRVVSGMSQVGRVPG